MSDVTAGKKATAVCLLPPLNARQLPSTIELAVAPNALVLIMSHHSQAHFLSPIISRCIPHASDFHLKSGPLNISFLKEPYTYTKSLQRCNRCLARSTHFSRLATQPQCSPEEMAAQNAEADWVDVSLPMRELKRQRVATTQPVDVTVLHVAMQKNAESLLNDHPTSPIFRVDYDHGSGSLYDVYEESYPANLRQEFRCVTCRKFMRRFGDLALVDEHSGALLPLFWNPENHVEPFVGPIAAVAKLFAGRKASKGFKVIPSKRHAGIKECGGWAHMSFDFPETRVRPNDLAALSVASTPELAAMLTQVLKDYDLDVVRRASQLVLDDKLSYADSHKASLRWLLDLKEHQQQKLEATDEVAKHNLLYHIAASSFLGCLKQLRSGAVGTLLSDVKENKSFQEIQRSWDQIAGPVNYMRPIAAPTAGNIAMAEQLFSSLGLTKEDMRREYLTPGDIPEGVYMFRDRQHPPLTTSKEGVFDHLIPKNTSSKQSQQHGDGSILDDPPASMSFSAFAKKVLPTATKVEYKLPAKTHIYFLITGRKGTKPLMQWHDDINRVSWYTHVEAGSVSSYGLSPGWTIVPYIVPFPHLWDAIPASTTFPLSEDRAAFKYYHGKNGFRYLIGLDGVDEQEETELSLFPTFLKSKFHGVRSTIEAYSKAGRIERLAGTPMVGGVEIKKSKDIKHLFKVTDQSGQQGTYEILLFE
jgi:hypothetical protein